MVYHNFHLKNAATIVSHFSHFLSNNLLNFQTTAKIAKSNGESSREKINDQQAMEMLINYIALIYLNS